MKFFYHFNIMAFIILQQFFFAVNTFFEIFTFPSEIVTLFKYPPRFRGNVHKSICAYAAI